jgi:hypothetical protein
VFWLIIRTLLFHKTVLKWRGRQKELFHIFERIPNSVHSYAVSFVYIAQLVGFINNCQVKAKQTNVIFLSGNEIIGAYDNLIVSKRILSVFDLIVVVFGIQNFVVNTEFSASSKLYCFRNAARQTTIIYRLPVAQS